MTSSVRSAAPFRITPQTSFILNAALLFMYMGAFYWLFVFDIDLSIKLILMVTLFASLYVHSRQYLFKNNRWAILNMVWLEESQWQLDLASGKTIKARLLGNSVVMPGLIILNFKYAQRRRIISVVIMPDSVDTTTFRRLSVKLRLYNDANTNAGDAV